MLFFRKTYKVDYSDLISKLEKGDGSVIQELLWQPKNKTVHYLPITIELIQKFTKEDSSTENLTIHKKFKKGRFELIIVETPWTTSDVPYSPIIIDQANSQIVGIMLPFNELHGHLSNKENKVIGDLGMKWIDFVIKYRLKRETPTP